MVDTLIIINICLGIATGCLFFVILVNTSIDSIGHIKWFFYRRDARVKKLLDFCRMLNVEVKIKSTPSAGEILLIDELSEGQTIIPFSIKTGKYGFRPPQATIYASALGFTRENVVHVICHELGHYLDYFSLQTPKERAYFRDECCKLNLSEYFHISDTKEIIRKEMAAWAYALDIEKELYGEPLKGFSEHFEGAVGSYIEFIEVKNKNYKKKEQK